MYRLSCIIAAIGTVLVVCGCHSVKDTGSYAGEQLMNVYEPRDASWDQALPKPDIPPPPTDVGLSAPRRLVDMEPLEVEGDAALAALSGIKGSGTDSDPFVLENGRFIIDKTPGIRITKTTRPLIIRNMQFTGIPAGEHSPNRTAAIRVVDSKNITISHCEVTQCSSIYLGGSALQDILVTNCKLVSCIEGIMSSGGRRVRATRNLVRDSVKYGVFLYNGSDHEIDHNYVAWTAREGIGTNGNSPNHYYHDNVILHSGWTAINVEGKTDNTRVEDNLVVSTFYGIILMGRDTICRRNRVFYSGQDGMLIVQSPSVRGLTVEDNLIVGSGQNGVWAMPKTAEHTIARNRIYMSHAGIQNDAPDTTLKENRIYQFMYGIRTNQKGVTVADNHIYQGRNGIALGAGAAGPVAGNRLHHLCIGLIGSKLSDITISENDFFGVGQMMRLGASEKVVIRDNRFIQLPYSGVDLSDCRECVVEGNTFSMATARAIKLSGGQDNRVVDNRVSDCYAQFGNAALILEKTSANTITGNRFVRCSVPILNEADARKNNRFADNVIEGE